MAKVDISTLYNYFRNGTKPPQEYFWNFIDSFWHKDTAIPQSAVSGLVNAMNGKASVNHGHAEYAQSDASNLDAGDLEAWKSKLGIGANGLINDAGLELSQDYEYLGITSENNQADFNSAVTETFKNLNTQASEAAKRIKINGNWFFYHKKPGGLPDTFQVGDLAADGWVDENCFGKLLEYQGGDPLELGSWKIIEYRGVKPNNK